jgi:hypothetical protein
MPLIGNMSTWQGLGGGGGGRGDVGAGVPVRLLARLTQFKSSFRRKKIWIISLALMAVQSFDIISLRKEYFINRIHEEEYTYAWQVILHEKYQTLCVLYITTFFLTSYVGPRLVPILTRSP